MLNNELISPLFCRLSSPFWKENAPENSSSGSQLHTVFSTTAHSYRIKQETPLFKTAMPPSFISLFLLFPEPSGP